MNTHLKGGPNTHRVVVASAGLALALGLSACGGGGAGGGNGPGPKHLDLVIGNSLPLNGSSRSLGQSGEKASQLAVDQIGQATRDAGADHTVRIVNEDQGADSTA